MTQRDSWSQLAARRLDPRAAHDLALAGLPGGRLQLFPRAGMGGGGAATSRDAATLGDWIEDVLRARRRADATRSSWPRPGARVAAGDDARAGRDRPSWPRRLRPRPSGAWRRMAQGAAFLAATQRGLAGRRTGAAGSRRARGRLSGRRRRRAPPRTACRWSPTALAFGRPSPPTWSRPACGWSRSARPTASASSRALEPLIPRVVAGGAGLPRSTTSAARAIARDIASMRHETQYTRLFRS